jgi:two-component system response regulator ResD
METQNKKILIAEDEKAMGTVLAHKLELSGFSAVHALNGIEAIEFLQKEHFDLALLDIMMPDSDGFDVLKKIKELNLNLPVIMLSNLAQNEDIMKAKQFGALDYLVKTKVTPAEIVKRVEDYFKNINKI